MRRTPVNVVSALLALALGASALDIPVVRKRTASAANPFAVHSAAGAADTGDLLVTDVRDLMYSAEILIDGTSVPVLLDTGSSDLWISSLQYPGIFSAAQNITGSPLNITYGIGSVSGSIAITDVEFADIEVKNQALLNVVQTQDQALFDLGAYGIVGLGFEPLSQISRTLTDGRGTSFLSNVFKQNPWEPNHIAIQLDRLGDLDESGAGSFSIGTWDQRYIAVKDAPALPVFSAETEVTRWSVLLDAFEVSGHNVTLPKSTVSNAPSGKLLTVLDTGSSLMSIPKELVTAIYSSIEGAFYVEDVDIWFVDCLAVPEVALWFGGQRFLIHPLDLTQPQGLQFGSMPNQTWCTSVVSPATFGAGTSDLDLLLGDTFLRNVYAVYNFGDTNPATGAPGEPYVQILSLTDQTEAAADFKASRTKALASLPPLGNLAALQALANTENNSSGGTTSPTTTAGGSTPSTKLDAGNLAAATDNDPSSISQSINKLVGYAPVMLGLLGLNAVLVLVLAIMGVILFRKRNGGAATRGAPRYEPVHLPPKHDIGSYGYEEPYSGRRYNDA
ncbi:hypothetical protein BOTBODRAFT_39405 [Botryobasidium botryosum FD-172 SS1]|uniref:Peptidase A1 domain-containing protein n=1 Tax=Botryobasidium botryosum (strain FD-172 SS1) TaxID=930990 RepID=A0A067LU87_BOTB1|nr:hypothetical protein BOTBODRAFT_39405 [Botryobasidium botryosum FD-172 SS1]